MVKEGLHNKVYIYIYGISKTYNIIYNDSAPK